MVYLCGLIALSGLILSLSVVLKKREFTRKIDAIIYIVLLLALSAIFIMLNYSNVALYDMALYMAELFTFFALAYIDLKEKKVDSQLMIIMLVYATISCVRFDFSYILSHFSAAIVGYMVMIIIKKIKPEQVGMGDVYIVPIIGLALGIDALFRTMFVGMLVMVLFSLGGVVIKKISFKSELPMLPFLLIGWVLCLIS